MNIKPSDSVSSSSVPLVSIQADASSSTPSTEAVQQDINTEESQGQTGLLLKSDFTDSTMTVGGSLSEIPPTTSSVLSSTPSVPLDLNPTLLEHTEVLSPSSSSAVSFISKNLNELIPGNKLVRDLVTQFAVIKVNLSKKEDIDRSLQERNEAFVRLCIDTPDIGAEFEELNETIQETESKVREIQQRIPVKQAVQSGYIREIQSVNDDELKSQNEEDSKTLSFNRENLIIVKGIIKEKTQEIFNLREDLKSYLRQEEQSGSRETQKINQIKDEYEKKIAELKNDLMKLAEKEREYTSVVADCNSRIDTRKAILEHGQRYVNDEAEIQKKQARFNELMQKPIKPSKSRLSFLKNTLESSKKELKKLTGEIADLKTSQEIHLKAIGDYQGLLENRVLQREEISVLNQNIDRLKAGINSKVNEVEEFELKQALKDNSAAVSLSQLRYEKALCNKAILAAADEIEHLGQSINVLPQEKKQEIIHSLAQEFISIGKWPPRSTNPFSEFRTDIVQEMLNIALSRRPPEYFGQTGIEEKVATTGIYIITVDVDVPQADGTTMKETRILGAFKPNDEAPGGRFARKPLEEVQPGLPPETADIRQNLVSKLGGTGSMDSVLVTALHERFNYLPADGATTRVDPLLKEGIFIEWMTAIRGPRPNMVEFARTQRFDNEYYSRVLEDVAFGNWDPNEGNQMVSMSGEGRLGVLYSWKQFDLDKTFPAGFVSMSNDPVWSQSPLAHQPMPLAFKERIRSRNIEQEIKQASHFWNREIDRKQARIHQSDDTPEDKNARIAALEACRWSESHANVLRARDTLLKVAVDLNATPFEISEMIKEITADYKYSFTSAQLRMFLKEHHRVEILPGLMSELTQDLHCFLLKEEPAQPVDLPNRLALEFTVARAKAIMEVDRAKQDALNLSLEERQQEVVKLTQEYLARQLRKQIEIMRSQRSSQPSAPISSSSSTSASAEPSSSSTPASAEPSSS